MSIALLMSDPLQESPALTPVVGRTGSGKFPKMYMLSFWLELPSMGM